MGAGPSTDDRIDLAIEVAAGRYDDAGRRYHTRLHVAEMFAAMAGHPGVCVEGLHPVLALATWFHDAVYEPRAAAGDNERASAELARGVLHREGLSDDLVDDVVALVLATATHDPGRPGADASATRRMEVFLDADLWILSAPRPRYEEYQDQVRQEYAHVSDSDFRRGRAAVLAAFADREHIYLTEHARRHWEPAARANLARELRDLRA